jgi:hypothetical protein
MAAASQQWEVTAASAGASQRELMDRLVAGAAQLDATNAQLRAAEEGRLAALREAEGARQAAAAAEAELAAARALLEERWAAAAGRGGRVAGWRAGGGCERGKPGGTVLPAEAC